MSRPSPLARLTALAIALATALALAAALPAAARPARSAAATRSHAGTISAIAPAPTVRFIPNLGQWPSAVHYRAESAHGALLVTESSTRLIPGKRLPGVSHFLRGPDPAAWITNVPAFDSLTVRDERTGTDVVLDGDPSGSFAHLFEVANVVALGAASEVAPDAALSPTFAATPTLAYSTYLGGRTSDLARGIAVDADGNAYIVGTTTSNDFPAIGAGGAPGGTPGVPGPFQGTIGNSGSLQDAFVTKLDPTGTHIFWSTYLGGVRQDEAFDVAVDAAGRAHVTGYTTSPDFPTARPVQPSLHLADGIWSGDAFFARLSADGSALEVGTFFGGTGRDVGKGIALGRDGAAYIAGWTGSNLPAVNAVYPLNRGVRDAFIAKYTPAGDQLAFTTHLGGADADEGRDIAVDAAGNATIVGSTISLNLRTTAPYQSTRRGDSDAFIARLNAGGTASTTPRTLAAAARTRPSPSPWMPLDRQPSSAARTRRTSRAPPPSSRRAPGRRISSSPGSPRTAARSPTARTSAAQPRRAAASRTRTSAIWQRPRRTAAASATSRAASSRTARPPPSSSTPPAAPSSSAARAPATCPRSKRSRTAAAAPTTSSSPSSAPTAAPSTSPPTSAAEA
ncbi:MAG: SBBP repeat-containing protein [Ardenticatenales bacterium]|nr:SBBP repeat-containing protein [Ardenticatenales bacterium]